MPKPRTNAEACSYWADGILTREPQPSIDVNSIVVRGDTVYSFGSHFPMGIIQRDARGRCVRVLLNSDRWPHSGGFANTGGDQSSCRMEANDRAACASWRIEVVSVPLTGHSRENTNIRCKPREGDPEPPYPRLEVPTYFYRTDPGPEPVKDPRGCIAGRVEHYEYEYESSAYGDIDPNGPDFTSWHRIGDKKWLYARRASVGRIVWGEEQYAYQHYSNSREPADQTYKQCPHCSAFQRIHHDWSQKYNGGWGRRPSDRGYKLYAEMIDTYGTEAEWRDARLRDWRRVAEGRKVYREWRARNYIPFTAVSWTRRHGVLIPNIDAEGYPTRKDQEAYYRAQREAVRAKKRRLRELEAYERERRQVERFKAGVRRRRRPTFEQRAAEVAAELAAMADGLRVTISTNESQEITA